MVQLKQDLIDSILSDPKELEEYHVFIRTYARENGYGIEVSDNGPGISTEILTKIKESFRLSNPVGTVSESYGLANINRRVHLYFGNSSQMNVESDQENHVTKITIYIDETEY